MQMFLAIFAYRRRTAMAWTDKMVEDLRLMWKQGLTTGEIGKRLGVSKNSIVGKVHRLQLDARPSPIKKKEELEAESVAAAQPTLQPEVKEPKKAPQPAKDVKENKEAKEPKTPAKPAAQATKPVADKKNDIIRLADLDNRTCRWPIGDPKDENFHFCGKKVRVGQTYCEEHSLMAYVKPTKK